MVPVVHVADEEGLGGEGVGLHVHVGARHLRSDESRDEMQQSEDQDGGRR